MFRRRSTMQPPPDDAPPQSSLMMLSRSEHTPRKQQQQHDKKKKRFTLIETKTPISVLHDDSGRTTTEDGISLLTDVSDTVDDVFTLGRTASGETGGRAKRKSSCTAIIKPRSDSLRSGMDRAHSSLTMNTLRFSETTLYGRDTELAQLKDVFGRAKITPAYTSTHFSATSNNNKRRQLVTLSGPAGAGKSALVHNLKPTILREAGFYLGGKFDQLGDEPYSAFTMACRELCDSLLAHKENPDRAGNKWQFSFEEMQATLQRELGGNNGSSGSDDGGPEDANELQVLTTVFPDLTQILWSEDAAGAYLFDSPGSSDFFDDNDDNSIRRRKTKRASIGYMEAKNRFNFAFRKLMRVLCGFGRVVLFLDDTQWADGASLDLIKTLVTDCRRATVPQPCIASEEFNNNSDNHEQGLIVIATYRSEEVDERHPLMTTVRELGAMVQADKDLSLAIHQMPIGNLELGQVNELLVDLLSAETPEKALSLAECVHRKTSGNVFYVVQFLKSLAADHGDAPPLLRFNVGTFRWDWSTEEITLRESATRNVVEIIQQKMETLPNGIRELLPIVACLGSSFEKSVFERVLKHFNDEVFFPPESPTAGGSMKPIEESTRSLEGLPVHIADASEKGNTEAFHPDDFMDLCHQEGLLIIDKKRKTIQWAHDKLQESALTLADPENLTLWRYKLGEFLMEEFDQKELEANIFIVVNLLDEDTNKIPKNNPKRAMLAELNRTAGERAMKGAAFLSAAAYLARGIQLLPEGSWTTHYRLCLQLYSSAAEAHHCIGKVEETQAFCEAVIGAEECAGRPLLDKQRAWTTLLDSIAAGGQTGLAQEKCLEVLELLDCKFPKRGWVFHTLGGLIKAEMNVKKIEQAIPTLSVMKDPSKQWVMKLLDKLVTYAFQNKSEIFPLVIFKGLKYTLKFGISDYTPPVLSTVGLLLAAALGDLEGCRKFGEMSLGLFEKVGDGKEQINTTAKSRSQFVTASFVLHWQLPLTSLRKVLLDGYRGGLSTGDVESALWSIMVYLEIGYHQGLPLDMLERDCKVYIQQMKDLQQEQIAWASRAVWQLVLNQSGMEEDASDLNGQAFNWDELFSCSDDSHSNAKGHAKRMRLDNAFWNGDFKRMVELIEEFDAHKGFFDKQFTGAYGLPPLHFHCGLACHVEYQRTGKKKFKNMAQIHSSKIADWAKKSNPNVVHYAKILEAEKISTKKKMFPEAVKLYKEAILLAGRSGFRHIQALGNERLGDFYARHELASDASYHLLEAVRLYREWGNHERGKLIMHQEHGKLGAFLNNIATAPSSLAFVDTQFTVHTNLPSDDEDGLDDGLFD
ncbi:Transcriptional regulator [Seminavis robusta]|uniref:Transcriptional regulator n=1 Tax=Seminavis robusta TaxID=568900 RepID=A0A9N8DAW9_9STRA|nr:Transcriptional regulator [Seminavis robusta]|eukprot:Sro58_g033680.1 Transcriptional regulator (1317) ;mRNA; f:49538-53488